MLRALGTATTGSDVPGRRAVVTCGLGFRT